MGINEFLVEAKSNTYASEEKGKEKILENGDKEFVYENGEWKYRDRYFGFNPFAGEEVVWINKKIIWVMNYYGGVISDKIDVKQVYQFLKKALRTIKAEKPFRGSTDFMEEDWEYKNLINGAVDNFNGVEMIYFKKEKVYELKYHGGIVAE